MKLWLKLVIWLVSIASVLLVLIAAIGALDLPDPDSAKARMQAFLAQKADTLDAYVENRLGHTGNNGLIMGFPEDAPLEAYLHLEYWADDQYVLEEGLEEAAEYPEQWHLASSSENAWRWEGGGPSRYVKVERLQPRWSYVEANLPT